MPRICLVALLAVLAVALAAPALAATPVKHAKVNDTSFSFSPGTLKIARGTKVVWTWVNPGGIGHNIAVRSGPSRFRSGTKATGAYSHVFGKRGTWVLYCTFHPWMTEKVVVK